MWSIKVYLTLLEATAVVLVLVVVVVAQLIAAWWHRDVREPSCD